MKKRKMGLEDRQVTKGICEKRKMGMRNWGRSRGREERERKTVKESREGVFEQKKMGV